MKRDKNGPRTALIRPRYAGWDPEFQEPLGAEAIAGYLGEHGLKARVFDRMLGASLGDIEEYDPDFVGFSLMTEPDAPDALRLRQTLEKPGRRFFAGGLFVTCSPSRARALFPSDTVLIPGEGEGPVFELVTEGAVRGELRPGPDDWAFASREHLDEYLARGGVINIRASRGCRGGCAFCSTPSCLAPGGYEARDVGRVADEMRALCLAGYAPVFNFTDDMFGDHLRILALTEELKKRGVRAAFSLEMRALEVCGTPPGLWRTLHEGGLCRVFTGLESLNGNTLRAWRKHVDTEKLIPALKIMRASGVACEVGYILWHAATEPADAAAEAEALHRLGLLSPKTALSRLILFPGSLLHRESGLSGVEMCALRPGARELYGEWERRLRPLAPLWVSASAAHPRAVCEAFLSGDRRVPDALEGCLSRLKDLTWRALGEEARADEKECEEIESELRTLHIACAERR